jgi:hypothetical protein
MPRPKLGPRHSVHVRLPEGLYAELVLLRPELQDPGGNTKYGAINNYFISLVTQDIESRKSQLRLALGVGAPT